MKRHQVWRLQYRDDRYMRDLPDSDLLTRGGDLMTAMLVYTPDGKIGMEPMEHDFSKLERCEHVLEELAIRGLDYKQPGVLAALNIPKPTKVRRALEVLAGRSWPEPILVKFGNRQHMASLVHEGKGRVSPASFYHDPSLGRARADNEGRIRTYVHPVDAHRWMGVREDGDGSRAVNVGVPYLGSTQVELYALTDFYVYCMAESCDARMFEDFDDTCVVITRPEEFTSRIQNAIGANLPGWKFITVPVEYFDPFFDRPHQMAPHFFKHFRFGYQQEHRFFWVPPNPEEAGALASWNHIPFDIGPLTAYAELICL